jgi:hypothetical protein
MEQAVICFAKTGSRFRVNPGEEEDAVFLVGLAAGGSYELEIDDEEMFEATADPGGILPLALPKGKEIGIRIRPVEAAAER